jgi:hypothetical protein
MAVVGKISLRYEDVAQDGRVLLLPLASSLGVIWREELVKHPLYPWGLAEGIIPILTRLSIEGAPGPFAVENPVEVSGTWDVTQTKDPQRFLLTIHTALHAPLGRTNLPPPDDAGERRPVGTVVAEHVFTRPFAEPSERRVTELGEYGKSAPVVAWPEPKALLTLPPGAQALDPELVVDAMPLVLGGMHTDSNQHVNSLVYPRLFEEAVLRRLMHHGRDTALLARWFDVRFRKPSFASDRLSLALQLFTHEEQLGALGVFFEPKTEPSAGRVFLQLKLH